MIKEFYELEVWKMGKILVVQIYKLTREFPKQETYGLVDQLRRAANSICANIAEQLRPLSQFPSPSVPSSSVPSPAVPSPFPVSLFPFPSPRPPAPSP